MNHSATLRCELTTSLALEPVIWDGGGMAIFLGDTTIKCQKTVLLNYFGLSNRHLS